MIQIRVVPNSEGYDQPYPAAAQAYKIVEKGRKSDAIAGVNTGRSVEPAS
jgi:hypothetical protein